MEEKKVQVIDLKIIVGKIWKHKKLYYKVLPIVFVLSCIYIFSLPRYYTADVKLAPEMESALGGGTLGSIASSLGFDLSEMQTSDAITPLLYPDLMEDNKFVTDLFSIKVESLDHDIKVTYHDYLKDHQKTAWWNYPLGWLRSLLPQDEEGTGSAARDPYRLSKEEDEIVGAIRRDVSISIDKKTGVISIVTQAQDPLICKTVADSLTTRLQAFITDYRTNKARIDAEYYKNLTAEAKREYEKARQRYGSYADANTDIILESYRAKRDDMENEMQLRFQAYSTLNTQLQAALAKVQERTPAFTLIKGASVPIKPAGPKRMIFVAGMLILAFIVTSVYIYYHYD